MRKPYLNAVSVPGRRHLEQGIPCQDAAGAWRARDSRLAVVTVADGAGSRRYAKQSAEAAVKSVVELFRFAGSLALTDDEILYALFKGQEALRLPTEDLGTTLLFVAVKGREYLAGHMGDGAILCREHGAFHLFSEPENGEFAYQTFFLPTSDVRHFRFYRGTVSPGSTFLLATDGVSGGLYESETGEAAAACEKIEAANRSLPSGEWEKLLRGALNGVFAECSDDDKSIAILSL